MSLLLCPRWAALAVFLVSGVLAAAHAATTGNISANLSPDKQVQQPLVEPSASARDLFSRNKERLLQVRVLLASASEQSSLGSGFVVRDEGDQGAWVVTNYHVVSAMAIEPQKYRIELRGTNERNVKAQLVAVDVIHDLAVLRTEPAPNSAHWNVFALRDTPLAQGTKVFSLGNPLELGFLISEGIYNGLVESRIYEQMLFSGALNSGMSGGPAIDEAGRVVGINVATRRDGELLSFLVPVHYARELLARAEQAKPRTEWRTEIATQLRAHQEFVFSKLLGTAKVGDATHGKQAGFASQVLAGRTVPTLDGSLTRCWANGLDGEKLRYQQDSLKCNLHADLFVRNNLYTGEISVRHVVLRNDKLPTLKFLSIASGARNLGSRGYGGNEMTQNECRDDYVQAVQHVFRVGVCVRAYKKFEGLYDYNVFAVQVDDARERQTSTLQLRGFSLANAQQLATLFLERLQ
jgi:S1-C subfamily serine protease